MRGVLELALLYDSASLERAFTVAQEYQTYAPGFLRGLLERTGQPAPSGPPTIDLPPLARPALPATAVHCDLGAYQRLLEGGR